MTQDFSDAPLTVDGLKVEPGWDWPEWYRKEVAEHMRQSGKSHLSDHTVKQRYVEWYAGQHGLTLVEARERVEAMS